MNLEDVMLNEVNQSLKNKYCMTPLTWGSQGSKIPRDRKQNGSFQELEGGRNGESVFNGYRILVGEDGNILEMDCDDGYTAMEIY